MFVKQAGPDCITYSMRDAATYQTRSLITNAEGIDIVIKSTTPLAEE